MLRKEIVVINDKDTNEFHIEVNVAQTFLILQKFRKGTSFRTTLGENNAVNACCKHRAFGQQLLAVNGFLYCSRQISEDVLKKTQEILTMMRFLKEYKASATCST